MKALFRLFSLHLSMILILSLSTCGPMPPVENDDITAPAITLTNPADGADGAAINAAITATFSEEMDASTINDSSFIVQDGAGQIAGTVTYSGTTATFTPSFDLDYYTLYTATVTTEAADVSGNALESDYVWTFTTGLEPDTTAPEVTSTSPADGADGIAINSTVSATFSEAMDASTINESSFVLNDGAGQVAGTVTYSGTTATFTPLSDLSYSTFYTATVTTSAADASGNPLASDYVWTFTTGLEPDIIAPVPGDSGLLAALDITQTSLRISWTAAADNRSMEPELQYRVYMSLSGNICSVEDAEANGTPLNEYTALINELPVSGLEVNTPYYFNVIVRDAAGNKAVYTMLEVTTLENRTKGILLVSWDFYSADALEPVLMDLGYPYTRITDSYSDPSFVSLSTSELLEYYAVFYVGFASAQSVLALTEYLDAGGSLYITDNDLGHRMATTALYQVYLQATFVTDNGGDFITGEGIMAGIDIDLSIYQSPDGFTVKSEGQRILKFTDNDYAAGVLVNRNGYKAIHTALDFHRIKDYEDKVSVITVVADYLCGEYL